MYYVSLIQNDPLKKTITVIYVQVGLCGAVNTSDCDSGGWVY